MQLNLVENQFSNGLRLISAFWAQNKNETALCPRAFKHTPPDVYSKHTQGYGPLNTNLYKVSSLFKALGSGYQHISHLLRGCDAAVIPLRSNKPIWNKLCPVCRCCYDKCVFLFIASLICTRFVVLCLYPFRQPYCLIVFDFSLFLTFVSVLGKCINLHAE